MPTIFDALKSDHDKQRNLLSRLDETHGNSSDRRALFGLLCDELEAHARAEERVLYSRMVSAAETRDRAAHSIAEHQEMRNRVDELESTDMSSPAWLATFRKLKETVEHHLDEEESSVFDQARALLNDQEVSDLRVDFCRKRDEAEAALAQERVA
jgi:hemerythrin superfamily protein